MADAMGGGTQSCLILGTSNNASEQVDRITGGCDIGVLSPWLFLQIPCITLSPIHEEREFMLLKILIYIKDYITILQLLFLAKDEA